MPIRFACSACEKTLKVDDRFAGRRAKCPNCGKGIDIPAASELVAAETSIASSKRVRTHREAPAPREESRPIEPRVPETSPDPIRATHDVLETPSPAVRDASPSSPALPVAESPKANEPAKTAGGEVAPSPPPFGIGVDISNAPAEPPVAISSAAVSSAGSEFPSPFEIYEDDAAEIIYADGIERVEPERFLVSGSRISLPRAFIYLQGGLLIAVAAICFFLGWAFGGAGGSSTTAGPSGPVIVDGVVRVEGSDGPLAAAEGALVALLPSDRKPPEKLPIEGLRPNEVSRVVPPRTLSSIREFGGALAVTDGRGNFRAELPERGEYVTFVVLPDVYRPSDSKIALEDLARLGDYFVLPDQLIGDCRYSLTTERVVQSRRLTVSFP